MKKIQTLLSGLAFLVTAAVVTAHAEEAAAETNAGLARLLDFRIAIALFVVLGICLLVSLVIWRMPRSKAKGEKDSAGQEVSDKDLEALRISYGFWLVVGALLITLLVLVVTLSALAPAAPKTTDIVAIIGAVTGVIGTLTAAFFGIQAAGAGRSQALTTLDNTLKNQAAVSAPVPTKLDPSYGPHAGSTRVSITGNGFTGASGVNFGVTPGTNFEFVNDGLVRASSPAAGDGGDEAKVVLIFPGATPQNRAAGTFYYYTIEPHHGVGGQPVTISGSGLTDVKAVRFGQKDATPTAGPKQNQLTVTAPTLQDAGNIADVDLTLIYAVDKPTNSFVIGKYHYDDAAAAGPQPPVGGAAKPPGPPSPDGSAAKPSSPPPPPKPDRFPTSVALTLVSEGGNDDDPRDPGGRTSRGITQNEWNNWRASHPGLPADVWQAPQEQVEAIYRLNYWNALACDQLPAGVDYCVFDYGVNSGNSRAAAALQQFVGTTVDGEIGPLTIAAAAKADPASLVGKICDQRLAFLKGLGTWRTFGNAWTRRVEGVRRQATAMIGAPTAPAETLPSTPVADPPWLVEARKYAQQGFRWASGNPPDQVKTWLNHIETNSPNIQGLAQYCDGLEAAGYWPWCGGFVAAMLAEAGLPPVFSGPAETDRFAWAPAWDVYGTKVDIENGELPQPGDIMRFAWHSGGEHVTFYDHPVDSDDLYHCCGGNQGTGHVVSIEGMPMSCIVAVRRPTAVVIAAAQPAAPAVPG
jgi:lysozyme family protein